jgi:hypothetical protein
MNELKDALQSASNTIDVAINAIMLDHVIEGEAGDFISDELCAINRRLAVVSMACGFKVHVGDDGVTLS